LHLRQGDAVLFKRKIFEENHEVVCTYLSPSLKGIKALIRIKKPRNVEHYKAIHKSVQNKYKTYPGFDPATKNAILPLFLSMDDCLYYRPFEEADEWISEDWSKPKYKKLNTPQPNFIPNEYDTIRTIRILRNKINNINDNGHPQVRSAALILGSRVAAGYLSQYDAENEIINLIASNSYLAKGPKGYIETAKWAIKEGMKTPKSYD